MSKFVIAFQPRSNCPLISWLRSPSAMILEPLKDLCRKSEYNYTIPTLWLNDFQQRSKVNSIQCLFKRWCWEKWYPLVKDWICSTLWIVQHIVQQYVLKITQNINWCHHYGGHNGGSLKNQNWVMIWTSNPTPGYVSRKDKNSNSKRYVHSNVHQQHYLQ